MSKPRIPLECAECLNSCIIQSAHNESISFCPFCGEALVIEFTDEPEESFAGFREFENDDENADDY